MAAEKIRRTIFLKCKNNPNQKLHQNTKTKKRGITILSFLFI